MCVVSNHATIIYIKNKILLRSSDACLIAMQMMCENTVWDLHNLMNNQNQFLRLKF